MDDALTIAVEAVATMFRMGRVPPNAAINVSYLVLMTTKGPHLQVSAVYDYGPSKKDKK